MLRRIAIAVALLVLNSCSEAADRPNILFIMSDDHTTQAIGADGSRLAKLHPTPTIDRLAREGMVFENASCTNSICTPSRACILTGQYNHVNGVYDLGGKIETERQSNAIVENVDFGPTMLAFAGSKTPEVMQGRSFREICETGEEPADWKQESYYR